MCILLEVHFQSIFEVYFKYTSTYKYTSRIYFGKRSIYIFEAHFLKLNQHFIVNLKYTSSILSRSALKGYLHHKTTSQKHYFSKCTI